MGIFKESLPDYIKNQLKIREAVISAGNNGPIAMDKQEVGGGGNVFSPEDAQRHKSRYQTRFTQRKVNTTDGEVDIDAGAFYVNALHKNCIVRMASLVDLQDDRYIVEDTLTEKNGAFGGPGMALTYILEGGTIIKGARKNKIVQNDDGTTSREISINQKGVMRRGFPHASQLLGGTYGDPIIRSNASQGGEGSEGDGYGIVPMPGITGVDIKTKSAYGSLREGKIKFECHNLRQLEILELLYMRPGYPVMVEWQWSQFINNEGKITDGEPWISDLPNFWDASTVTQTGISELVVEKRKNSGGNYDAILGFCKNFSYKARSDGGFTCTTELMAVGEVLNSIKGNMVTRKNPDGNDKEDMPYLMHLLNTMVDGVIGMVGGAEGVGNEDDFFPDFESEEMEEVFNNTSAEFFNNYLNTSQKKSLDFTITAETFKNVEHRKKLQTIFNLSAAQYNSSYKDGDPGGKEDTGKGENFDEWVEQYLVGLGWVKCGPEGMGQTAQGSTKLLSASKSGADNCSNAQLQKDNSIALYEADHKKALEAWAGTSTDASANDALIKWQQERSAYWGEAMTFLEKEVQKKNAALMNEVQSSKWTNGVHIVGPTPGFDETGHKTKFAGKMGYIRLDAFCSLLNSMVIPKNTKDGKPLISFQTNNCNTQATAENGKIRFDQFKLNQYGSKFRDLFLIEGIDLDVSVDPYICLLPHQVKDMSNFDPSDKTSNMFYKPINDVTGYMTEDIPDKVFFGEGTDSPWLEEGISNNQIIDRAKKSIGLIYLNIDMLHKQCHQLQQSTSSEHFSIGKFMSNVITQLNKALGGNHKLGMVNNQEFPNVINIVDVNGEPGVDGFEDVAVINVQSNDSVVREWSFNTEIPSAMTATIAVAAQNPNDPNALDEVTFAAINRGIRNRLYRPTSAGGSEYNEEERKAKLATLMNQIDQLGSKLGSLRYYNEMMQKRSFEKDDDNRQERVANQRSTVMGIQTLVDVLSTKDDNGLPRGSGQSLDDDGEPHNPPSSTPIPIKVDLTFDGIGGLVIGQLFRVRETRLPRQYRRQNIVFLVKSESQRIDKGGNWITKIQGQMQLFPLDPKAFTIDHQMQGILDGALRKAQEVKKELDDQGVADPNYDNSRDLFEADAAALEELWANRLKMVKLCWDQAKKLQKAMCPSDEDEAAMWAVIKTMHSGKGSTMAYHEHGRLGCRFYEKRKGNGGIQDCNNLKGQILDDIDDSWVKLFDGNTDVNKLIDAGDLGKGKGDGHQGWKLQSERRDKGTPSWMTEKDGNGDPYIPCKYHVGGK